MLVHRYKVGEQVTWCFNWHSQLGPASYFEVKQPVRQKWLQSRFWLYTHAQSIKKGVAYFGHIKLWVWEHLRYNMNHNHNNVKLSEVHTYLVLQNIAPATPTVPALQLNFKHIVTTFVPNISWFFLLYCLQSSLASLKSGHALSLAIQSSTLIHGSNAGFLLSTILHFNHWNTISFFLVPAFSDDYDVSNYTEYVQIYLWLCKFK